MTSEAVASEVSLTVVKKMRLLKSARLLAQ
jgi:hypothetical protein